jgi:hypothetical protein
MDQPPHGAAPDAPTGTNPTRQPDRADQNEPQHAHSMLRGLPTLHGPHPPTHMKLLIALGLPANQLGRPAPPATKSAQQLLPPQLCLKTNQASPAPPWPGRTPNGQPKAPELHRWTPPAPAPSSDQRDALPSRPRRPPQPPLQREVSHPTSYASTPWQVTRLCTPLYTKPERPRLAQQHDHRPRPHDCWKPHPCKREPIAHINK